MSKDMKPYLKLVIAERKELLDKLDKLKQFMLKADYHKIDAGEQFLLISQAQAMEAYAIILDMRIKNGVKEPQEQMTWRSIESAPKDINLLLTQVGNDNTVWIGSYFSKYKVSADYSNNFCQQELEYKDEFSEPFFPEGWYEYCVDPDGKDFRYASRIGDADYEPTHWMPMPTSIMGEQE